jgi:hypothetical protein
MPGLAALARDGRIGQVLAEDHYAGWPMHRVNGERVRLYEGIGTTLADQADSYLWLGPIATYAYAEYQPPTDPDDIAEVARRSALLRGSTDRATRAINSQPLETTPDPTFATL